MNITPGPWLTSHSDLWGDKDQSVMVYSETAEGDMVEIAHVYGQETDEERIANLRLIEASPWLLMACKDVLQLAKQLIDTGKTLLLWWI